MYNINFTSLDLCGQDDVLELYYGEFVIINYGYGHKSIIV